VPIVSRDRVAVRHDTCFGADELILLEYDTVRDCNMRRTKTVVSISDSTVCGTISRPQHTIKVERGATPIHSVVGQQPGSGIVHVDRDGRLKRS